MKKIIKGFLFSLFLFSFAFGNILIIVSPNIAIAKSDKVDICHKEGQDWKFMDTPAGSSLDGHLGHGDFLYEGDLDLDDKDNWCIDNAPQDSEPEESGSLKICKIVLDSEGNSITGEEGSTFTISFSPTGVGDDAAGVPDPVTFDTPLVSLEPLFGDIEGECQTIDNLAFGKYYYNDEEISDPENWETPKYFDSHGEFSPEVPSSLEDFNFRIVTPGDTPAYDNYDGSMRLNENVTTRTLFVLNQMKEKDIDTSTVTMCKTDEEEEPLSGWTLMLLGKDVQTGLSVPTNSSYGVDSDNLMEGVSYIAEVIGTWLNQGGANPVDAEYSTTDNWISHMDGYTGYSTDILELQINNTFDPNSNWGAYNSNHEYAQSFIPSISGSANFRIFDGNGTTQEEGWFGDNSGNLTVDIYEGYSGITADNGCVVFEEVPYGTYGIDEIMQDGWENDSGLGDVVIDEETEEFVIVNSLIDFCLEVDGYQSDTTLCPPPLVYACSDDLDNDEDGKIDAEDSGCWSSPNNPETYNENDNDETDPTPQSVDLCENIDGDQETVPDGYTSDGEGQCTQTQQQTIRRSSGSRIAPSLAGRVLGAEATCGIYVDKFLKKGMKNNDKEAVKKVQEFLNNYMNSGIKVDGIFGEKTEQAVKAFQLKHADKILKPWNIKKPTGIFYITTQTEVNNIMCPELKLLIPALIPTVLNPLFPKV